jgi:hypothetical protein
MRSLIILLIASGILLLPCQGFAQTQVSNNQAAIQQGEKCFEGNVLVRIKLKNGEKIEGGLLEKTPEDIKVCRKGNSRLIATNDISELKTKLTGNQRFKHTIKVLGIAWGAIILYGLIRYGASKS